MNREKVSIGNFGSIRVSLASAGVETDNAVSSKSEKIHSLLSPLTLKLK